MYLFSLFCRVEWVFGVRLWERLVLLFLVGLLGTSYSYEVAKKNDDLGKINEILLAGGKLSGKQLLLLEPSRNDDLLYRAVTFRCNEVLKRSIFKAEHSQLNVLNNRGVTPFFQACRLGNLEAVELFLIHLV